MTKYKILEILMENKGKFISGEALSKELQVSRTAIWKGVASLKSKGYNICGINNKGYSLMEDDSLIIEEIKKNINCKEIAKEIKYFKAIDSTNTYIKKEWKTLSHGTVVLADEQTKGRGKGKNSFYSPKESGIYVSIFLKKDILPDSLNLLNLSVVLSVIRAVRKASNVQLVTDWNSLLINDKKVGGYLIEEVVDEKNSEIEGLIVGIGINVNNNSFPSNTEKNISSLKLETKKEIDRKKILYNLLDEFENIICEKRYIKNRKEIIDEYSEKFVYKNLPIKLKNNNRTVSGKIIAFDEKGGIVLLKENNAKEVFYNGQIKK